MRDPAGQRSVCLAIAISAALVAWGLTTVILVRVEPAHAICNDQAAPCIPELPEEPEPKPTPAPAPTKNDKWVIVLCNFTDHQETEPGRSFAYYERMYTEKGAGQGGLYDYFQDISYGKVDITGSVVKGWYTLPMTLYQYNGLARVDRIQACASAAVNDVDFSKYRGVITIQNLTNNPDTKAVTTLAADISASDTTISVTSSTGFPAPPFPVFIDSDELNVTAVSGDTWTVQRGYGRRTAAPHAKGTVVKQPIEADYGFAGPPATLGGKTFPNLGMVDLQPTQDVTGAAHEMGHGFGLAHSRRLSTSATDYNDCWDIMSAYSCVRRFTGSTFGGSGPGLNAPSLASVGWLPPGRVLALPAGQTPACRTQELPLVALNNPAGSGYMQLRVPATRTIQAPGGATVASDYYSVELRHRSEWDRAIPANTVLVHLHGTDGYSYLVESPRSSDPGTQSQLGPQITTGQSFADPGSNVFITVKSIDPSARTAKVLVGNCPVPATDLGVSTTGAPEVVAHGETITYTSVVANEGSQAVPDVLFEDVHPEKTFVKELRSTQGKCQYVSLASRKVTCNLGRLDPGDTITVVVRVGAAGPGTATNEGRVSTRGNPADFNTANDRAEVSTTVYPIADLTLSVDDDPDPVRPARTVTYSATVTNDGPSWAHEVVVREKLPAGARYESATASQGSCFQVGANVVCALGLLRLDEEATVKVSVTAPATEQTMTNAVDVQGDESDNDTADNSMSVSTTVEDQGGTTPDSVPDDSGTPPDTVPGDGGTPPLQTPPTILPRASAELSRLNPAAGEPLLVRGSGFTPGQVLNIMFFSTPVLLGSVTADAQGRFEATVIIPPDAVPGVHQIVVAGPAGTSQAVATVTVAGGSSRDRGRLAHTGANVRTQLLWASAALLLGDVALLAGYLPWRRRRL